MTVVLALKVGRPEEPTHLYFATDSRCVTLQDRGYKAQKLFDVGNESSHIFVAGVGDGPAIYNLVEKARSEFGQRRYVRPSEVAKYLTDGRPEAAKINTHFVVAGCEGNQLEILDVSVAGQIISRPFVTEGSGSNFVSEGLEHSRRRGYTYKTDDLVEGFFTLYDVIEPSWEDRHVDNRLQIGLMRKDGLARMIWHPEAPFMDEYERRKYLTLNVKPKSPLKFKGAKRLADEFYYRLMLHVYHMSEEDSEYNKISDDMKNIKGGFLDRIKLQRSISAARSRRTQAKHNLRELLSALENGGQSMRDALLKDCNRLEEAKDLWK